MLCAVFTKYRTTLFNKYCIWNAKYQIQHSHCTHMNVFLKTEAGFYFWFSRPVFCRCKAWFRTCQIQLFGNCRKVEIRSVHSVLPAEADTFSGMLSKERSEGEEWVRGVRWASVQCKYTCAADATSRHVLAKGGTSYQGVSENTCVTVFVFNTDQLCLSGNTLLAILF